MSLILENKIFVYFWRGTLEIFELLASPQSSGAQTIRLSSYSNEEGVDVFVLFSLGCSNNPGEIQREEAPGSAGTAGSH